MRFAHTLITLAAVYTVTACSSTRIQTDFDHQADFTSFATFAWQQARDDRGPTDGPSQIVDGRIRRAIADNLIAKGYRESAAGEADLLVAYYTTLGTHTWLHTSGWGWGWGPYRWYDYGYWPGWSWTTAHTVLEGTVIVDIIDRSKNQLVWRGVSTRALGRKSTSEEKINGSMARLLVGFPPA